MALLGRGDVVAELLNFPPPETDTLQGGLHSGDIVVCFLPCKNRKHIT